MIDLDYSRITAADLENLQSIADTIERAGNCFMRTEAVRLSKLGLVQIQQSVVVMLPKGEYALKGFLPGAAVKFKRTHPNPSKEWMIGEIVGLNAGKIDGDGFEVVAKNGDTEWVMPVNRSRPTVTVSVKTPSEPWATYCFSYERNGHENLEVLLPPWEESCCDIQRGKYHEMCWFRPPTFEEKHPTLAAIGKFFKRIKDWSRSSAG